MELYERHSVLYWVVWLPYAAFIRLLVTLVRSIWGYPLRRFSKLTPNLWVGGQHYRRGWKRMQQMGITAMVNMRRKHDDALEGRAPERYLWLPTTDNTPPSLEDLAEGIHFIRNAIADKEVVYVHCRAGVGRAPTMVAAYLVSTGMSPAQAWTTIRAVRPFIFPTPAQAALVRDYYLSLTPTPQQV